MSTTNARSRSSRAGRRPGFSLLELLAVVTILGISALVVIPRISVSSTTAKQNACFQNKAEINSAVERYYFENGSLPADTTALGAYFPDGVPSCPVSGNARLAEYSRKPVPTASPSLTS